MRLRVAILETAWGQAHASDLERYTRGCGWASRLARVGSQIGLLLLASEVWHWCCVGCVCASVFIFITAGGTKDAVGAVGAAAP